MTDDQPRLAPARQGFSLSFRGKTLLSSVDPLSRSKRIADSVTISPLTLYFCPSPLLFYGVESLLSRLPENSFILCVETDQQLMALSLEHLPPSLQSDSRFQMIRTSSPASVCRWAREKFGSRAYRRLVRVNLNGGWSLSPDLYAAMEDALRSDMTVNWSNAMTLLAMGRLYARNAARNLGLLPRSLPLDSLTGPGPILVCGAGPSLDSTISELSDLGLFNEKSSLRKKLRIFCVDTALPALLQRGFCPDLVIALEAQHWNLRDFLGAAGSGVTVAMDLSALSETAGATTGRYTLYSSRWASLSFLTRLETAGLLPTEILPLGSVGLSAVQLALRLGSGSVFVTGLDFSWSLDASHARGTPARLERERRTTRLIPIINAQGSCRKGVQRGEGKDGAPLLTDRALSGYCTLFKREFGWMLPETDSMTASGHGRLWDLGKTGLPLGIPLITATEVVELILGQNDSAAPRQSSIGLPEPLPDLAERTLAFIEGELDSLARLKAALTGETALERGELERILDSADYLWAHFPECAGGDGMRPDTLSPSFLKRVRVEIDSFCKAFSLAKSEILAALGA